MSCDFYFKKWKFILARLEMLIRSDLEYQTEGAHDQLLSDAVLRVTSIVVQYMKLYNEVMECVQNNLQVQKAEFMNNIVNAIASRILELKRDLEKLEGSPFHYLGTGLIVNKQTYDPEMTTVPKLKRTPIVEEAIETAFQRVKEKREAPEEPEVLEEEKEEINQADELYIKLEEMRKAFMSRFGDADEQDTKSENVVKENIISQEERVRMDYLNLIKAHEKLRQLTRSLKLERLKREAWEKELLGTAAPVARYELRQKAARLIQKIIRAYFEIRRKHIKECKRDQILGLAICKHLTVEKNIKVQQKTKNYAELFEKYEKECTSHKSKVAKQYLIKKGGEVSSDFRDRIMQWFYEWFESIRYIHEIPKDGSIAIFREEVPDPYDWLEEYEEYLDQTKGGAVKTPQEIKYEKQREKELERQAKKQEKMRQKVEAALLKKMMRFPTMHPGYHYKQSRKTNHLLELIHCYHKTWDDYDSQETSEAKRKYVAEINVQEAYINAQREILQKVDEDMKMEYLRLKNALRKDYKNNGKIMPEQIAKGKGRRRRRRLKAVQSERLVDKLETLAMQGFVVEYPETKLEDYFGDPNFSGDDYRRLVVQTFPQSNEIRSYWWNRCLEVAQGSQRILVVGPKQSGRTTLVYALASMNGAVLFELDPVKVPKQLLTPSQLTQLTKNVLYCAKAVEPSVIYVRNLQKLFYIKEPPEEVELRLSLIKRFFLDKIFKKIKKHEKVTIIGACSDPWLARNRDMVKHFPNIVLLPSLTYSLTELLLKNWVDRYFSIPPTFDVISLAYMLAKDQKYSYGNFKRALEEFMSHERLIRIAVYGLDPMEVYDYILDHEPEDKVDYERYLKWYFEKTPTGTREKEHYEGQLDFKNAVAELKAKEEGKQKIAKRSAISSAASSRSAL